MPDDNNVILLDDIDKMPFDEAISRVRALMIDVKDDLYKICEITQCDLTDDDRETMNDYLTNAFGDWQAAVQGSLEEVAYVFGEAASTCYDSWRRREAVSQMQLGAVIPNGATVVDYTVDKFGASPGGVVLCTAFPMSADPFVTWNWWVDASGAIACSGGHYFDTIEAATADFKKRAHK
jgi:hypothetical protein